MLREYVGPIPPDRRAGRLRGPLCQRVLPEPALHAVPSQLLDGSLPADDPGAAERPVDPGHRGPGHESPGGRGVHLRAGGQAPPLGVPARRGPPTRSGGSTTGTPSSSGRTTPTTTGRPATMPAGSASSGDAFADRPPEVDARPDQRRRGVPPDDLVRPDGDRLHRAACRRPGAIIPGSSRSIASTPTTRSTHPPSSWPAATSTGSTRSLCPTTSPANSTPSRASSRSTTSALTAASSASTRSRRWRELDHRLIRAAYWAMCDLIDVQVGRLLAHARPDRPAREHLVLFMSDHGEMLGDHGFYLKGPFFYEPGDPGPARDVGAGPDRPHQRTARPGGTGRPRADACSKRSARSRSSGCKGKSLWPLLTGESNDSATTATTFTASTTGRSTASPASRPPTPP